MRRTLSAVLLLLALAGAGCAQNRIVYAQSGVQVQPPQYPSYQGSYTNGAIPSAWLPLYQRLRADGLDGPDLPALFASMGTPSQDPMGRKIKELYTKAFAPKPKPTPPSSKPTTPARPKPLVYPGVITAENVEKCRAFLEANKPAFDYAERTFGVPRQISVSLLFVETRLGTFLGKEKAFYTLASMASSRRPEAISTYVAQLPGSTAADRQSWIQQRMEQRSDWAYKELVALLKNIRSSGEDALAPVERLENLDVLRKVKKLWGPMDDYFMQAHGGLFLLSGAIDDLPEEEFPEHFGMTKQDFEDEYGD